MSKLCNFPEVYWLTLEESHERQKSILEQFEKYNIKNHTMIFGYDAKENDFTNHPNITGNFLNQMSSCDIACTISHLKMVKEWYYNSNAPYAVFFEDDINFETVDYWNFTWNDVMKNIPHKWNIIQMCMVREPHALENNVQLHSRTCANWSGAAYLISREYAKRLIDDFCDGEKYILHIKGDPNSIPYIENVIFFLGEPECFTVPLFTEKVKLPSNFYPFYTDLQTKESNLKSEEVVRNWWIQNGKNKSVEEIMVSVNRTRIINTFEKSDLNSLICNFVYDSEDPENNYKLAAYYESIGQHASAISYYLRTAERATSKELQYECLICASICFDSQGTRNFTVKGLLQHAVTILPTRPEAYYHLSRFYERENNDGKWNDCYMIASIGQEVSDHNSYSLRTSLNYPQKYGILFQKAVSSWWCGLCEESRNIFLDLKNNYDLSKEFLDAVNSNLERIGG
jgi:hypothetical protein